MDNPSQPPPDGIADDFFDQIFSMPAYASGDAALSGGDGSSVPGIVSQFNSGDGSAPGGFPGFPLRLSLDQGTVGFAVAEEGSSGGKRLRELTEGKNSSEVEREQAQLVSLFPAFGHVQPHQIRSNPPKVIHCQSMPSPVASAPQPPAPRPRVRARRGQATDPHSIAERVRRERIAERMRQLQDLVPNTNKTDRAAMLDEIVDYVKFLRLQVKVLSMSRLGGAGAVAQLVADIPLSQTEGDNSSDGTSRQQVWEKWSIDGTERQVAKLMEEDVGAAMQFLQSKALCMMPISLAAAIYHTQQQPDNHPTMKNEPNTPPS